MHEITYQEFEKVELRVGRITKVEDFPQARKPAYKLTIDFGPEIGIKKSSAQITDLYTKEEISAYLLMLSEMVGRRLRRDNLLAKIIRLTVRYKDMETFYHSLSLFKPNPRGE